jgi:RNase P subunit RPR2
MYLVQTELGTAIIDPRCDICAKPLSPGGTVVSLRPEDTRQAEDAWMFCQACGNKISLSTDPKTTFVKMFLKAMYTQYDKLQAERAQKN